MLAPLKSDKRGIFVLESLSVFVDFIMKATVGTCLCRTCLTEVFTDVDPLSVGQPTADGCPSGRGHRGVDGVDVIAQVDRLLYSLLMRNTLNIRSSSTLGRYIDFQGLR